MTQTSKHIYFVISVQHFIPTGGIGSFFRGFLRMANASNWDVTVVLDKKPFGQSRELMEASTNAKFVWPATVRSYAEHTKATQFKGEQINQAKVANFKDALGMALAQREPDHILINTPDAFQSVEELGLQDRFRTTFYTLHENLVVPPGEASDVFAQEYNEFLYRIPSVPNVRIATQSNFNVQRMNALKFWTSPIILQMPIPDAELLLPYTGPRSGVLFIGRHEPRKDPKLFVKTIAATGLPAKVLTNKRGIKKFQTLFAKHGVTDFEIKGQITGKEKTDFIKSAKVAFHPATSESYGFSAMETLAAGVPTLLIEEREWWRSFAKDGVHLTSAGDVPSELSKLYATAKPQNAQIWAAREQGTQIAWQAYI